MFEFADHAAARETAAASLEALFDVASRVGGAVPSGAAQVPAPATAPAAGLSKRDFLRGGNRRERREP
jgi:hypothetical protein